MMFDTRLLLATSRREVRALAVTTLKRTPMLPDFPTIAEAGFPARRHAWLGLVGPAGTPPAIVAKLNDIAVEALHDAGVQASLGRLGVDIVGDTPEEFKGYIAKEVPKWAEVVKASGAHVDK